MIYFLRAESLKRIKIGYSQNPKERTYAIIQIQDNQLKKIVVLDDKNLRLYGVE